MVARTSQASCTSDQLSPGNLSPAPAGSLCNATDGIGRLRPGPSERGPDGPTRPRHQALGSAVRRGGPGRLRRQRRRSGTPDRLTRHHPAGQQVGPQPPSDSACARAGGLPRHSGVHPARSPVAGSGARRRGHRLSDHGPHRIAATGEGRARGLTHHTHGRLRQPTRLHGRRVGLGPTGPPPLHRPGRLAGTGRMDASTWAHTAPPCTPRDRPRNSPARSWAVPDSTSPGSCPTRARSPVSATTSRGRP